MILSTTNCCLTINRRLMGFLLCSGLIYTSSRAFFLLDQRLPGLKFEHGSRVCLYREPVLTRGNTNQIHAAT
jgi:hypothetical protein